MRYHHQLNFRKLLQFSPCWILMMHSLFRWEVITGDTNSGPHQNWPKYLSYKPKQKHPVGQRTTSHWYNVPRVTEMKKILSEIWSTALEVRFNLSYNLANISETGVTFIAFFNWNYTNNSDLTLSITLYMSLPNVWKLCYLKWFGGYFFVVINLNIFLVWISQERSNRHLFSRHDNRHAHSDMGDLETYFGMVFINQLLFWILVLSF